VHRLRAASHAIITGVGTLIADDPSMNVRLSQKDLGIDEDLPMPHPVRVVLDPNLDTPVSAKMFQLPGPTLVVCGDANPAQGAALEAVGAQVITVPGDQNSLDLNEVLQFLATQEINEVLLETGATLAGAMLEQRLIDELIIYQAPLLMGNTARGLFNLPGIERMSQRIALQIKEIRQVGPDIRITAIPQQSEE
jgi:diaminohydroxyphosphoribosylaminopyrimidine deaminase/5-amino-6-(5-phosphoribosylamino)uracil reductase